MEVTLEQAYAKACQIIGEQIVQQRIMAETQAQTSDESPDD